MNPETVSPEFLREMPLFSGFNATDLSQISDIGGVVEFQPERLILEQGATSRDLWILLDGRCEVTRRADPHDAESKRVSLAHLEPRPTSATCRSSAPRRTRPTSGLRQP